MNKAYSNKALPAGTVLREWRLEEVLGVGGFGIVYKGRGIYFDELVAIKEYFPSSISERDDEDTVVPIDSDAEEVHALGLKKFVEEAKLLWNLSTPSRHPNIVSVRSLFEIHGTAYMVMDFEDGTSLSRVLKDGNRFNERSLWEIIRPIAEGLERAHRVGVLHRDIKPPNILITPEGRPVLIDFGSARFDTAEATSTKVTFHTPPYAAIEQYVKTYDQGPWTDIYALGVVLYECVTGKKPPEVLERLHGGLGEPLAAGKWPGYGKAFLSAIDSAMTIKPSERPQSISEWLAQFDEVRTGAGDFEDADDEKTRFYPHEVAAEEIVPIAPPAELANGEPIETKVPADPNLAQFKRAGHDTKTSKKVAEVPEAAAVGAAAVVAEAARPDKDEKAPEPKPDRSAAVKSKAAASPPAARNRNLVIGGAAAAVLAVGVLGWTFVGGGNKPADASTEALPDLTGAASTPTADTGALAGNLKALADEGRAAGAPEPAIAALVGASDRIVQEQARLEAMRKDPAQAAAANTLQSQIGRYATRSNQNFAAALMSDAEARTQRLARAMPWTVASSGRATNSEQRFIASTLQGRMDALRASANTASTSADAGQSLGAAKDVVAKYQALIAAVRASNDVKATPTETIATRSQLPLATPKGTTAAVPAKTLAPAKTAAAPVANSTGVSAAKLSQFNAIIADGRGMAKQVMSADKGANGRLAKTYDKYLATLKDSMRGVKTDAQADQLIKQAKQTRAYLVFLVKQKSN